MESDGVSGKRRRQDRPESDANANRANAHANAVARIMEVLVQHVLLDLAPIVWGYLDTRFWVRTPLQRRTMRETLCCFHMQTAAWTLAPMGMTINELDDSIPLTRYDSGMTVSTDKSLWLLWHTDDDLRLYRLNDRDNTLSALSSAPHRLTAPSRPMHVIWNQSKNRFHYFHDCDHCGIGPETSDAPVGLASVPLGVWPPALDLGLVHGFVEDGIRLYGTHSGQVTTIHCWFHSAVRHWFCSVYSDDADRWQSWNVDVDSDLKRTLEDCPFSRDDCIRSIRGQLCLMINYKSMTNSHMLWLMERDGAGGAATFVPANISRLTGCAILDPSDQLVDLFQLDQQTLCAVVHNEMKWVVLLLTDGHDAWRRASEMLTLSSCIELTVL